MTPEREAEIRAVLNGDLSVDMDAALPIVSRAADDLLDEVERLREGIADARTYCSRSTFCVTTWPTTLPGSPA